MRCLFWAWLLIITTNISAQNLEANHWYFGYNASLIFHPNGPIKDQISKSRSTGSVATISNSIGELQFYASADTVYSMDHKVMIGGKLGYSGKHLALKKPQTQDGYYLLTLTGISGPGHNHRSTICHVAEINMAMNGGKGEVISKSVVLPYVTQSGGFALLDHANGIDKWLVLKSDTTNKFAIYGIRNSGIRLSPDTVLAVGDTIESGIPNIKSSPNSRYLSINTTQTENLLEILLFDNLNGIITKKIYSRMVTGTSGTEEVYSSSFTPNSKELLVARGKDLLLYDLSSEDSVKISLSRKKIKSSAYRFNDVQLGLDGNMYFLDASPKAQISKKISRILCPDNMRSHVRIEDTIIGPLGTHLGTQLPTLNQTLYVNTHKLQAQSLGDSVVCPGDSVTLTAYGAATSEFYWSPATGLSCTNCQNPKVSPSKTTTYTVRGIARSCAKDVNHSAQITIYVSPPKGQASISGDTLLCPGKTAVLTGPAGFNTYAWSNGVVGRTQTVQAGGSYQLQVSNKCYTDTLSYTLKTEPVLAYRFPNDTVVCASDLPIELSGWSNLPFSINYSNQPKYEVTRPGEYIYEVRSACSSLDYFVKVDTVGQELRMASSAIPDTLAVGAKQRFEFNGYSVGSNKEVSSFAAEDSVQITQLEDDKNGWIEIYQLRNNGVCSDTLFIKRIEIIKPQAPDTLPQKSDCNLEIAPNPGSLEFSLSTNQNIEQLAVFDARSKKLIELESLEKGVYTFSAAKWSAGTYYISAQCADGSLKKLRWIKVK